jgi:polyether ionophore transport system permease protein
MTAQAPALSPTPGSGRGRVFGLGSVFGKTMRDSRRATIGVGAVLGLLLLLVSAAVASEFATAASRQELGALIRSVPPIMQGLAGKPVNVESLGGYVQYKYGTFFPLIVSLWSILALSGTLASESRRGSMEFLAALPMARRRIATQKLLAHVVSVTFAVVVVFVSVAIVGTVLPKLPGDEISIGAAASYAIWLELLALAAGAVAFAIAPFLGRGAAIGIAGAVMFGGFILNGYQVAIPELAPFANLTWFGWTTNHIPLAGEYDPAPLLLVAAVALIGFVIGIEAFARRDLGATTSIPTPSLPRAIVGLRGPTGRAFGENVAQAVSWGIGLGLFALVLAGSGQSFADQLQRSPDFVRLLSSVFPDVDLASVGGFLELVFVEFGLVLAGLAAATLVHRWASDETSGRLEMLLATRLARTRWVISGGLAALGSIVLIVVLTAAGIALGATITGGDIVTPVVGTLVIGLYAAAFAGIGIGIGGLFSTAIAGPAVALLVVVTWFIDVVVPALGLPDAIHALALSSHYGQPMVGHWDATGIWLSVVLAIAGVAIGAWGFGRRDLRG